MPSAERAENETLISRNSLRKAAPVPHSPMKMNGFQKRGVSNGASCKWIKGKVDARAMNGSLAGSALKDSDQPSGLF
jgi:hypothetical protein